MNFEAYNYNVPAFVAQADSSSFDTSCPGSVVIGGFRLDNKAATWVAGAEMRKNASSIDSAVLRKIATAMQLFGIDDSMYETPSITSSISISDGEHTAEFSIYDNDSLNKAARGLLDKRASLPYAFAHDCAVAIRDEALTNGYEFDDDVMIPLKKLAGAYHVDFAAGKELLESAANKAHEAGLKEHSDVLNKLASMCTPDCSEESAPYFIAALDEFNKSGLDKTASAKQPEEVFYISNTEAAAKRDADTLKIDTDRRIRRGMLNSEAVKSKISKWASICGYNVPASADASEIVGQVSSMPEALRQEFVELFG